MSIHAFSQLWWFYFWSCQTLFRWFVFSKLLIFHVVFKYNFCMILWNHPNRVVPRIACFEYLYTHASWTCTISCTFVVLHIFMNLNVIIHAFKPLNHEEIGCWIFGDLLWIFTHLCIRVQPWLCIHVLWSFSWFSWFMGYETWF